MSEFENWFKTTEAYKMMEEQNYFKMNLFFFVTARNQYSHSGVQVAYLTWQHQQAKIDELQKRVELLEDQKRSVRVLCETACERLDDYDHQDAMVILDDLEEALRGEHE